MVSTSLCVGLDPMQRRGTRPSLSDFLAALSGQCEVTLHTEINGGDSSVPSKFGIRVVGHSDLVRTRQQENRWNDFAGGHFIGGPHAHSPLNFQCEDKIWH